MAQVLFAFGSQSKYDQLAVKSENTMYFITDTSRLYKGDVLIADANVKFESAVPADAPENVLYVVTDASGKTGLYTKVGSNVVQVGGGEANEIADGVVSFSKFAEGTVATDISNATNPAAQIPTVQAVQDAITAAVNGIDFSEYDSAIVDVTAAAVTAEGEAGTILTFTRKSGNNPIEITIGDLFLSQASYDNTTHILTLTVGSGEDAKNVTVDLQELIPQAINASQVALAREITVTTDVGNLNAGDKIILEGDPTTGQVKASDVQALFEAILSKDVNPTAVQPSGSITLSGAGAKEVGTSFTPSYTTSFNPGKYTVAGQADQPSGVTATSYAITDTNGNTANTAAGTLTAFTVQDNTAYKVNATINYSAGNVPKTFLDNPYPAAQIQSSESTGRPIQVSSSTVTGYRNCWWGFKTVANQLSDPAAITAAQIKALGTANRTKPTSYKPTGSWKQMFFAVPASQANSLSIVGTDSPLPQTVSGPISIQIGGVNNYAPIAYNVFYVNNATESSPDTYKLTWSNS